jgi:DNA-binding transcriptional MerR regulator
VEKSPEAFRTISEAADELDLPQHVLRFWETRFSTIKPLKRGGGRRYYRPEDVLLLKGIRHLLYDQGFTIKGVQKILKDQGVRHVAAIGNGGASESLPPPETAGMQTTAAGELADAADEMSPVNGSGAGRELSGEGRDKLEAVLRELLECKRLLERARE